ncbi:MAG: sodium:solute symporter family protein [Oscillospiraceae bacterium]|jgi:SSS family solute:Na+ symporter|nr:sodium:solute symporter family protein [Oscillospiraceae bacterium]
MPIKIALILIFAAVTIAVGLVCRKRASDVAGFVLGGRNVGSWLTAFAYGTSYFSAVIFVGYAGQFGWKYGMSATWIGLGNAFIGSLLAWLVLGRRTRSMTRRLGSTTMPDFFEARFGSKKLKLAASAIIFVFLIPYTASLYNGLSRVFEMAFNIPYEYCIIGMAVITAVYVVAGGYFAAAINDFIQGIIMIGGIIAVIAAVASGQGGFGDAVRKLGEISSDGVPRGSLSSLFGPDPLNLLGVVILTSLGTWGLPQMVHKFYAIKSESAVKRGTIISTVFALVVAGGCYLLGGFGRLFDAPSVYNASGAPIYDAIIPRMLSTLPDALIGVVVMLVFSASMSTLSSLVLTSSSTLTLDFIKGSISPKMTAKAQLSVMRILVVVFIFISASLATVQYKSSVTFIAQLMGISWGALAGSFLAPFLYGLYMKRTSTVGVWVSFACGVGITVANMLMGLGGHAFIKSPINAGAAAMLTGLIVVPIVSAFTKSPNKEHLARVFGDSGDNTAQ